MNKPMNIAKMHHHSNGFRLALCVSAALVMSAAQEVSAAFIYPTPVSSDVGQFNSGTGVEKLVNMGFTSPAALDSDAGGLGNSYVSLNKSGWSFPATITLTFADPTNLDAFYLWNHANNNLSAQITYGVKDFDLEFYSDISATILIGSVTGLSAAIAPQTGPIPAQTFAFPEVENVQAVKWVITSNQGAAFLAAREIAFNGTVVPEPGSLTVILASSFLLIARRR